MSLTHWCYKWYLFKISWIKCPAASLWSTKTRLHFKPYICGFIIRNNSSLFVSLQTDWSFEGYIVTRDEQLFESFNKQIQNFSGANILKLLLIFEAPKYFSGCYAPWYSMNKLFHINIYLVLLSGFYLFTYFSVRDTLCTFNHLKNDK